MAHEVETMAYANATPWHGLGFPVDDCLTPQRILEAAKLNWDVSRIPLEAALPNGEKLASQKHFMLVRNNHDLEIQNVDGKTLPQYMDLGVCGPEYTPFQNKEVFEFFTKFTEAGHMKMETAGSLRRGQMVWALAKINSDFELAGGDKVGGYLLLSNPHIWGKAATAMLTQVRVVCNNTLTWALGEAGKAQFRMPHLNDFASYAEAAEKALGLSLIQMAEFKEQAEFLSSKRMYTQDMHEFLVRVFQPGVLENISTDSAEIERTEYLKKLAPKELRSEIIANTDLVRNAVAAEEAIMLAPGADMESARGTYWGGVNGVTYVVDHMIGRDRDAQLEQAWFGQRASLKRKAVEIGMEMANAA